MFDSYQSSSSSSKYDSSFEYLAMEYDDFDVWVSDVNGHKLEEIGKDKEIEHLSAGTFPVEGFIYGLNLRYMVPLVLRRHNEPDSKTLEAFYGAGNVVSQAVERKKCTKCGKPINEEDILVNDKFYTMAIQDQSVGIQCKVSKGHFEKVNILSVDAMQALKLSIDMDWKAEPHTFKLIT